MKKIGKIVGLVLLAMLLFQLLSFAAGPLFRKKLTQAVPAVPAFGAELSDRGEERVMAIDNNETALLHRLRVIEQAEKELTFATYSYKMDESGRDITAALYHAANRGVHIRILVDGLSESGLRKTPEMTALGAMDNVEIRFYNPIHLAMPWKINYRMHDKYLVADDRIYILGGRNTRNVSLGAYQPVHDADRDVLVYCPQPRQGNSVFQVKAYFEQVWQEPCAKAFTCGKGNNPAGKALEQHYEELKSQYPQVFETFDWQNETLPASGVALLHNPVNPGNKEPVLWQQMQELMRSGRNIAIQTPYIVCGKDMYEDIRTLSESQQVTVLTNSPITGANGPGCADFLNQHKKLRNIGAEIWEYAGPDSCHAKTVLIDDRLSLVGSFNFDMRSAYIDTELMLLIDSPQLNSHLRQVFDGYLEYSSSCAPDGTCREGIHWTKPPLGVGRAIFLGLLRIFTLPMRHLL